MATSGNEWYIEWQRITKSGTMSDSEWQRMTMSDKEWQWVVTSANFFFFLEDSTSRHPKGNPLNPEENLEEHILN